MEEVDEIIIELSKKYNKSKKTIEKMMEYSLSSGYDIEYSKNYIEDFLK